MGVSNWTTNKRMTFWDSYTNPNHHSSDITVRSGVNHPKNGKVRKSYCLWYPLSNRSLPWEWNSAEKSVYGVSVAGRHQARHLALLTFLLKFLANPDICSPDMCHIRIIPAKSLKSTIKDQKKTLSNMISVLTKYNPFKRKKCGNSRDPWWPAKRLVVKPGGNLVYSSRLTWRWNIHHV